MIGNDIVDLSKAKKDTNIWRPRFLEKVCSKREIDLITTHSDSFYTFWRLWTMKESAYKAFQRDLKFQPIFNPFAFECELKNKQLGTVNFEGKQIDVKTFQTTDYIYSEVINVDSSRHYFGSTLEFLKLIRHCYNLKFMPEILKSKEGIPSINLETGPLAFSKTHHGKFQVFQY